MDLPTALSIGALIVAIVSAVFTAFNAHRAFASFRLQRLIDARGAEFREVAWDGGFERATYASDNWIFRLTNIGLTSAVSVTLVVELDPPELYKFASIGPGESRSVSLTAGEVWHSKNERHMPLHPGFRVYWTSEKGHPDTAHHPVLQLFT